MGLQNTAVVAGDRSDGGHAEIRDWSGGRWRGGGGDEES